MIDWPSLATELSAFVLVFVVYLFAQDGSSPAGKRTRLFMLSLSLAATSIALNVLCSVLILEQAAIPHVVSMLLNTAYYLFSALMAATLALYLLDLVLEHVHDPACRQAAHGIVIAINVAFALVLVANMTFAPGIVFSFGDDSSYTRGPFFQIGYSTAAVELAVLLACYVGLRSHIARHVVHVVRLLPPIVVLLLALQLAYPSLQLNGITYAIAMLIVFASFQSTRIETDGLTRVGTRSSFFDELARRHDEGKPFHVIAVSLLDLPSINLRLGHRAGDEALLAAATWLASTDRAGFAYRYGKVTFALVRPDAPTDVADALIARIAQRFTEPWEFGGSQQRIAASCVDIIHADGSWEPEQTISYLDAAIDACRRTHVPVLRFDDTLRAEVDRSIELTELLKDAVARRRFRVHYQPIVDAATGLVIHAEALIRLDDEQGRPIPPEEFVHMAEQAGMVEDLTRIVLDEVCRFLKDNPDVPVESISVNLPMPQLLDEAFPAHIAGTLARHGVAANKLGIEVTERIFSEDQELVAQSISRLEALGVSCYLDDFGMGYSNMAAAMHLPFEYVKIDRSLLLHLPGNEDDRRIVQALVDLLHAIGFAIVAEGVETAQQAAYVRGLGVECIQGYFYSKPLPEADFAAFAQQHAASTEN